MKLTIRQTALILLGSFSVSAAELTLQYDQQQQTTTIPDHHRLADAYAKLKLPADIDWLSALITNNVRQTVVSQDAISLQRDLVSLTREFNVQNEKQLARSIHQLAIDLKSIPVAARIPAQLDPDWVRVRAEYNLPLEGKYTLYAAPRSTQLHLFGLTGSTKMQMHDGWTLSDYLSVMPVIQDGADKSDAYLIEPDGHWQKIPIALWNRREIELAPGSTLFIGLDPALLPDTMTDLNERIATYLANRIPE